MNPLWALVERENIYVKWANLRSAAPEGLQGMYYHDPALRRPVIVLDRGLPTRPRLLRSVLAEELGHHFTVPQAAALRPYFSFANNVAQGRDETRARRWAAAFLVPDDAFAAATRGGQGDDIAALAERFQVTEEVIRWKLGGFKHRGT